MKFHATRYNHPFDYPVLDFAKSSYSVKRSVVTMSHWLSWLTCTLLGLSLLFFVGGSWFWFQRQTHVSAPASPSRSSHLPRGAFERHESDYQQIGGSLLSLQQAFPSIRLPDLRPHLIYYGKNGRPDAQSTRVMLHFYLNGGKAITSTPPGEKLYLTYGKKNGVGYYDFSPGNDRTALWIVGTPLDGEVQVEVGMENDGGELISEPEASSRFRLPEKECVGHTGKVWEVGGFRVDGTLFARQKGRWCGCDQFLEKHGGVEHRPHLGKQRLDFGEADQLHSVFVQVGDCLIWKNDRWTNATPGEESFGYPLLIVKKIDERIISFDLWDVEGKGKVVLNLLKTAEPWTAQNAQNLQHSFKFVGAKTKTECLFEIDRKRVVLRPSDWLLLTPQGWKKLSTEEEIDQYVQRKLSGTLFVVENISRADERPVLIGTLYSPSRHACQRVEFVLQTKTAQASKAKEENKEAVPPQGQPPAKNLPK